MLTAANGQGTTITKDLRLLLCLQPFNDTFMAANVVFSYWFYFTIKHICVANFFLLFIFSRLNIFVLISFMLLPGNASPIFTSRYICVAFFYVVAETRFFYITITIKNKTNLY
ncbi:hypothetical protein Hanom_Chr03g00187851 [Helianthus anomalus]